MFVTEMEDDMAERHRSKDGRSETAEILDGAPETPDFQGRDGGRLARKIGTEDELRRYDGQGVKGVTRVGKSDADDTDGDPR